MVEKGEGEQEQLATAKKAAEDAWKDLEEALKKLPTELKQESVDDGIDLKDLSPNAAEPIIRAYQEVAKALKAYVEELNVLEKESETEKASVLAEIAKYSAQGAKANRHLAECLANSLNNDQYDLLTKAEALVPTEAPEELQESVVKTESVVDTKLVAEKIKKHVEAAKQCQKDASAAVKRLESLEFFNTGMPVLEMSAEEMSEEQLDKRTKEIRDAKVAAQQNLNEAKKASQEAKKQSGVFKANVKKAAAEKAKEAAAKKEAVKKAQKEAAKAEKAQKAQKAAAAKAAAKEEAAAAKASAKEAAKAEKEQKAAAEKEKKAAIKEKKENLDLVLRLMEEWLKNAFDRIDEAAKADNSKVNNANTIRGLIDLIQSGYTQENQLFVVNFPESKELRKAKEEARRVIHDFANNEKHAALEHALSWQFGSQLKEYYLEDDYKRVIQGRKKNLDSSPMVAFYRFAEAVSIRGTAQTFWRKKAEAARMRGMVKEIRNNIKEVVPGEGAGDTSRGSADRSASPRGSESSTRGGRGSHSSSGGSRDEFKGGRG